MTPRSVIPTRILGVDVGKTSGLCFMDTKTGIIKTLTIKFKSLRHYYDTIDFFCAEHEPQLILSARPTRYISVIQFQNRLIGIVELLAEERELSYIEYTDSHCKKLVFGNGAFPKKDIKKEFKMEDENEADARMFIECYLKEVQ